jgi:hypothetical protein
MREQVSLKTASHALYTPLLTNTKGAIHPSCRETLIAPSAYTAPSAPGVDAPCTPRGFCGGTNLRLVMTPLAWPRLPQEIPQRVPRGPSGGRGCPQGLRPPDVCSQGPASSCLGAEQGDALLRAPRHLSLPPPLAAESLRTSCYNPHTDALPPWCSRSVQPRFIHRGPP